MPGYTGSAWRGGFGRALRRAVCVTGLRGLGPDRGAPDLVAVDSVALPPTPPCPERVEIALLTPLRLVEAGRLVGPEALRPRHLLLSLLRRVSTLAERHGPAPLALDYRALKKRAAAAEFASSALRWVEWARYSGRQQALLQMGGLLGKLSFPLEGLEPFWPFLALAPWVHVGKGATMGLGAMRVAAA